MTRLRATATNSLRLVYTLVQNGKTKLAAREVLIISNRRSYGLCLSRTSTRPRLTVVVVVGVGVGVGVVVFVGVAIIVAVVAAAAVIMLVVVVAFYFSVCRVCCSAVRQTKSRRQVVPNADQCSGASGHGDFREGPTDHSPTHVVLPYGRGCSMPLGWPLDSGTRRPTTCSAAQGTASYFHEPRLIGNVAERPLDVFIVCLLCGTDWFAPRTQGRVPSQRQQTRPWAR